MTPFLRFLRRIKITLLVAVCVMITISIMQMKMDFSAKISETIKVGGATIYSYIKIADSDYDDLHKQQQQQQLHGINISFYSNYSLYTQKIPKKQNIDMRKHIAIGLGIATRYGTRAYGAFGKKHYQNVNAFPFFAELLRTFCRTASKDYFYHFYAAYDYNDNFFKDKKNIDIFEQTFRKRKCKSITSLRLIKCNYTKNLAWAQNDAMLEAYLDDMEFYFRLNDDTLFMHKNWANHFIDGLRNFQPPNVGVVGPAHMKEHFNWTSTLECDFVHKSHLEIFGFYYPRIFTDWFADNWITNVYHQADERQAMLYNSQTRHTKSVGTRYKVHMQLRANIKRLLPHSIKLIRRYADVTMNGTDEDETNEVKVISMSLSGDDPIDTWGAIINAQLRKVLFPHWIIRYYVEQPSVSMKGAVPQKVINKLQTLGSEIVFIDPSLNKVPMALWSLLVADDVTVHRFIIRRPRSRLTEADAHLVEDWIRSDDVMHCIRDHPDHADIPIIEYLWGAKNAEIRQRLKFSMAVTLLQNAEKSPSDFMVTVIWPELLHVSVCHDSVSCHTWYRAQPMPANLREGSTYLGQTIDSHNEPIKMNGVTDEYPVNSTSYDCYT